MPIDITTDPRFSGIEPMPTKLWLISPTMHGDELRWMTKTHETNWMSTVGGNIDAVEREMSEYVGVNHAVALSTGTAALHLAVKLAGERLYGQPNVGHGTLEGRKAFCSDVTFDATDNPVAYEGGEAVWKIIAQTVLKAFRYEGINSDTSVTMEGFMGSGATA